MSASSPPFASTSASTPRAGPSPPASRRRASGSAATAAGDMSTSTARCCPVGQAADRTGLLTPSCPAGITILGIVLPAGCLLPEDRHVALDAPPCLHSDRAACRGRHCRRADRPAPPGRSAGASHGTAHRVSVEPPATRPGGASVLRQPPRALFPAPPLRRGRERQRCGGRLVRGDLLGGQADALYRRDPGGQREPCSPGNRGGQ